MENDEQTDSQIKTNKVLAKYIEELADDVKLSEYNIREKSLTASTIWAKWLSYLFNEKENLQRIANTKKKIIDQKMNDNKNNDSVLRLKTEDKIVNGNETIQKLNILAKQTQDNIDYIERALNILSGFGYNIKNCVEVFKLQFN